MKSVIAILGLLAVIVLVQAYARTDELRGSLHAGVVERVFVEQYPGIYVDRIAGGKAPGGTTWVHVNFPRALEDGRTSDVASVPGSLNVDVGDLVEMRFAGGAEQAGREAFPVQNRVTAVLQKHGTIAMHGVVPAP
jgi:hypothetical protein